MQVGCVHVMLSLGNPYHILSGRILQFYRPTACLPFISTGPSIRSEHGPHFVSSQHILDMLVALASSFFLSKGRANLTPDPLTNSIRIS